MSPKRSYSLSARLRSLLLSMFLLPLLAGVGFFLLHSSKALQGEAVRDLNAALSLERQFIELWVRERTGDVGYLAADPRMLSLPASGLTDMLGAILKSTPGFNDLAYVDETGRTRADARHAPGVDVSDRAYFKAAREGKSYVSEMLTSRTTGTPVFIVSSPVKDARGRFRGLVFGSVGVDTVATLMGTLRTESSSRSYLAEASGKLIVADGKSGDLARGDVVFDRAVARQPLPGLYRNAAGQRVVGAYLWILDGRWLLVADRTEASIMSTHAMVLGVPLLGAALVFLVLGPSAMRLARALSLPLKRLEDHAKLIQAGNFEVDCGPEPDAGAPDEVRRLDQAYCLMVERVRGALEELRLSSFTDHLTGAANRKLLYHDGPRLIEAASRGGQPVTLLMLDLDHFKAVNDEYGHAGGDSVLAGFAALLHSTLRKSDLFVRYGGEEFVVLAPNADQRAGRDLGERIRAAVERLVVPSEGRDIHFTVSVGAATLQPGAAAGETRREPLEALLGRADEALYMAKAAGRNRVEALPLDPLPAKV